MHTENGFLYFTNREYIQAVRDNGYKHIKGESMDISYIDYNVPVINGACAYGNAILNLGLMDENRDSGESYYEDESNWPQSGFISRNIFQRTAMLNDLGVDNPDGSTEYRTYDEIADILTFEFEDSLDYEYWGGICDYSNYKNYLGPISQNMQIMDIRLNRTGSNK